MQIVIDIPEERYKDIQRIAEVQFDLVRFQTAEQIIAKGTPLPKGHGRLIDISQIEKDKIEKDNPIICLTIDDNYTEAISLDYLDDLPTIIEADKAGEEE